MPADNEKYIILETGLFNNYRLVVLQYNFEKDSIFPYNVLDIYEHDDPDVLKDMMNKKFPDVIGVITDGERDIPDEITPWEAAKLNAGIGF